MAFPTAPVIDTFSVDGGPPPGAGWIQPAVYDPVTQGLRVVGGVCTIASVNGGRSLLSASHAANFEAYFRVAGFSIGWARLYGGYQYPELSNPNTGFYRLDVLPGYGMHFRGVNTGSSEYVFFYDLASESAAANDEFGFRVFGSIISLYKKPAAGAWARLKSYISNVPMIPGGHIGLELNQAEDQIAAIGGGTITEDPETIQSVDSIAAISDTRVELKTTCLFYVVSGYSLERSLNGTDFVAAGNLAGFAAEGSQSTLTITGLTHDTLYYFRLRPYVGSGAQIGYGQYSPVVSATTLAEIAPYAPTLLTATAVSNTQINLAWTDNAENEDGFEIERSLNGSTGWALIDTTGPNVTTRTNTSLSANTTYYYRVRAFNGAGYSAYSNIASATTMAIPNPPTLLTATAVSASRIDLAWLDNATNENGYKIERGADGLTFVQIDVVGPNSTAYQDTGLESNTLYYYRVRAYNADGDSAYSNIASATTLTRCAGGLAYFDVLFRTARLLENLTEGTATGDGTTTTLVDTHLGDFSGGGDDDFNGGSVFWKTHKDRPIASEVVGAIADATAFSGALDVPPVVAGSVVLSTPGGAVTDDGAGVFESAVETTHDEPLDFTVSVSDGTASAQLAYLRTEAGTATSRYGAASDGYPTDTDDGAGHIDFWIPIYQYETLGAVAAARSFAGNYPTGELPITPGDVTLQVPDGLTTTEVTDDEAGAFASMDVVLTGETGMTWDFSLQGTAHLQLLDGAALIGNLAPDSVTLTWDNGVDLAQTNTDDGAGNIDLYIGATIAEPAGNYPGTIDYATGRLTFTGLSLYQVLWLGTQMAPVQYITFDATYTDVAGTINYTTGAITLNFAVAQTGTITILNLFIAPHTVPATLSYTTGALTLTGLTPGDAAFMGASPDYTITYGHRRVTGTIVYTTGVLALYFDRLVTGLVTAAYTKNERAVFLPVIMRSTDFDAVSGAVTFEPTGLFNLAVGRGDAYGVSPRRYPYYLMFQKLNEALAEIKTYLLDQADIPVASIVNNEITLADSVRIFKIWNGNTSQAPQDWRSIERYRNQNGRVRFYDTLVQDTLRIQYFADVPEVTNETDCLPRQIDATWLAYETAVKCVRWRLFQPGADEKSLTMQVNDLMARASKARARLNLYQPTPSAMKLPIIPDR